MEPNPLLGAVIMVGSFLCAALLPMLFLSLPAFGEWVGEKVDNLLEAWAQAHG